MRWVFVGLFCAALLSQESSVLRVTTRLMQVNILVTDKHGHPVEGLTKNDFTVTEDGKPQTITNFSVESMRVLPAPAVPLPPDVHTNRYELKGGAPTAVTVILLDLLNTKFTDRTFARRELLKYLRAQLHPEDRVALYALDSELRLLYDFSTDATALVQALDRFKPHAAAYADTLELRAPDTGLAALDRYIMKGDQLLSDMNAVDRVHRTVGALVAIAQRVAAVPGRKNLVWLTGGIPFSLGIEPRLNQNPSSRMRQAERPSQRDSRDPLNADANDEVYIEYLGSQKRIFNVEAERAARALDAANVAVYPVDVQGLIGNPGVDARDSKSMSFARRKQMGGGALPETVYTSRDTMKFLAARTGGTAFVDSNDLTGSIRKAVDDTRLTYVIAYQPSHGHWDGHFQKLKVKVSRPDVTVRHRGGYMALPDESGTAASRQAAVLSAVANPLEATGIRMVVATRPDTPGAGRLAVRVLIEPSDISLTESNGHWKGKVDLAYVQQPTSENKNIKLAKDEIEIDLTPEAYSKALEEGVLVHQDLAMAASAYRLKVIARDVASGATGSVEILSSSASRK